jgi:pimeloyl-ACP methyl ester carboxylesterase
MVLPQSASGALGDALLARRTDAPLVLIGFSYGADDVLRIARRLSKAKRRVDLLITIDPVTPPRVPANVGACVNYYQSNGAMDLFPWLRGVPLTADREAAAPTNFNLRKHRRDLLQPNTSHATIASHAGLQGEIVQRVVGVVAPAGTLSGSIP